MVGTPCQYLIFTCLSQTSLPGKQQLARASGGTLTIITGGHNHKDQLTYAWKMLLQNAPHDSICGCSIDEAHREMEVRFAKVNQVGNFVKTNLLNEWKGKLATQKPRVSTSLRSSTLACIIRWTPSARLSMLRFVHLRNCIRQKASRKWLL